jgi:hypothetical protein
MQMALATSGKTPKVVDGDFISAGRALSGFVRGVAVIGSAITSQDGGMTFFPWRCGTPGQLSPSDDNQSGRGSYTRLAPVSVWRRGSPGMSVALCNV